VAFRMTRWLVLAIAACAATAQAFTGVVTHVSDGDTLWVRPDGSADARQRKPVKIRLQGIDAPERCQAWGLQSKAALESRVLHQRVRVQSDARDDYGRTLGNLRLLHGEDVSAWLVLQGHAWSYRHHRSLGPYGEQERQARAARRGLFAEGNALEPRLFRKRHGPCADAAG